MSVLTPWEVFGPAYDELGGGLPAHRLDRAFDRAAPGAAMQAVATADIVVGDWTGEVKITADDLGVAGRCAAIVQPTAGFDSIDIDAAAANGIPVSNTPGANTTGVAEWVVMAGLVMLKGARQADADLRDGHWRMVEAARDGVFELAGRTVGIVGLGSIGRAVAQRVRAFEPKEIVYFDVAAADPLVQDRLGLVPVDLDRLFELSDVVTLHVPLLPSTRHLVGARRLELLGRDGVLINTARGGVVDSDALYDALAGGRIKGAALDVFDQEPLPAEHRWSGLPNVLLSPHLAGSTNESRFRMIAGCLRTVAQIIRGEQPGHVVNGVTGLPRCRWRADLDAASPDHHSP